MRINGKKSEEDTADHEAKHHQLMNATGSQIGNYVDNNVTDLASAKELLKVMLRIQKSVMRRIS